MPGEGPVHRLSRAGWNPERVVNLDAGQNRDPIPKFMYAPSVGDDVCGVERDLAHLQCAVESPE